MLVRILHPLHFLKEIFNFDILDIESAPTCLNINKPVLKGKHILSSNPCWKVSTPGILYFHRNFSF